MQSVDHTGGADDAATDAGEPESVDEAVDDIEDMLPDPLDEIGTGRPAQDKLHLDQQAALETFVDEGFADRRAYLQWLQDVCHLSLGRLHPNWYAELGRDTSVLAVVITDPAAAKRYHRKPPAPAPAKRQRRRLATKYIRPAFSRAYREFRGEADERVDDDDDDVDPREAETFALRPTLDFLKDRQEAALNTWLDGFDDRGHLDQHLHRLDDLSLGEFEKMTPDWDWQVEIDGVVQEVLLGQAPEHVFQREQLAARFLLPAFARTPKVLLARAKEVPDDGTTGGMSPTQI